MTIRARGNLSLAKARRFDDFSLYYLGREFRSMPLTGILSEHAYGRGAGNGHDQITFLYGTCVSASGQGCAPPLQLNVYAACDRPNRSYVDLRMRGVTGRRFKRGGGFALHTKDAMIAVSFVGFRLERRSALRHVAMALRGVNNPIGPGEPLPGPAPECG